MFLNHKVFQIVELGTKSMVRSRRQPPSPNFPDLILLSQVWVLLWSLWDIQKSTGPKARNMTEAISIPTFRLPSFSLASPDLGCPTSQA